jgi:hypothetical protein
MSVSKIEIIDLTIDEKIESEENIKTTITTGGSHSGAQTSRSAVSSAVDIIDLTSGPNDENVSRENVINTTLMMTASSVPHPAIQAARATNSPPRAAHPRAANAQNHATNTAAAMRKKIALMSEAARTFRREIGVHGGVSYAKALEKFKRRTCRGNAYKYA